jgi:hypothetical protein
MEQVRDRVLHLAREIEELTRSDVPPKNFFEEFLKLLTSALGAQAGAIWMIGGQGQLRLACEQDLATTGFHENPQANQQNFKLLSDVLSTGEACTIGPNDSSDIELPTENLMVLGALQVNTECRGVVQIFQRADSSADVRPGYLQFVEQMCGLASMYLARIQEGAGDASPAEFWKELERFTLQLQRSLDVNEVTATAANDARALLKCDRVSVALKRGKKTELRAISGQDRVNRKANLVRSMEKVASRVVAMREPLIYTGDISGLAPQLEEPLADYIQESGSRMVMFLPLLEPAPMIPKDEEPGTRKKEHEKKPVGCVVIEQVAQSQPKPGLEENSQVVSEHIAGALCNARNHQRIFLLGFWKFLGKCTEWLHGRKLIKTLIALAVITAVGLALAYIPMNYRVEGQGRLMPTVRQEIFAPSEGEIVQVFVTSGSRVKKGDKLVRLHNDVLQAELLKTRNERIEKNKLVIALISRVDEAVDAADRAEETKLLGQLAETRVEIVGLNDQITILEKRIKDQTVLAPLDGVISTFQLERMLTDRPVRPGEVLMEIMNDKSEPRLEIEIEEKRIGHILRAEDKLGTRKLYIEFVLASAPESTYEGTLDLDALSTRSRPSEEGGNVIEAFIKIDSKDLPTRIPGSDVRVKIYCGKRSMGYVFFGDVVEFVQKYLWL